jgi:hypothetical protein
MRSLITPNADAGPVDFGLFQIAYSLSGEQEGVIMVDLASGLSNSQIRQSLSGEMEMSAEGQTINVPLKIEGMVKVESSRVEP